MNNEIVEITSYCSVIDIQAQTMKLLKSIDIITKIKIVQVRFGVGSPS